MTDVAPDRGYRDEKRVLAENMNALNRQVSRSLVYFGPKGRCTQTDRERFLLDRQLESKARQANRQPTKRTPQ